MLQLFKKSDALKWLLCFLSVAGDKPLHTHQLLTTFVLGFVLTKIWDCKPVFNYNMFKYFKRKPCICKMMVSLFKISLWILFQVFQCFACVPVYHKGAVFMEAWRGHLTSWNWSYRLLWLPCGCWTSNLSPLQEQPVLSTGESVSSPAPPFNFLASLPTHIFLLHLYKTTQRSELWLLQWRTTLWLSFHVLPFTLQSSAASDYETQ